MYLAEFNIGILRYDWDDPRLKDFTENLDRVYALAMRSPGYVWHLSGDQMEAAQLDTEGPLGGNPRAASSLSVWEDAQSLEDFTFRTVHRQFYDRRAEWYAPADQGWGGHRLVMWWVDKDHRPSMAEAVERLDHLAAQGESETAFGWAWLRGQTCAKGAQTGVVA